MNEEKNIAYQIASNHLRSAWLIMKEANKIKTEGIVEDKVDFDLCNKTWDLYRYTESYIEWFSILEEERK